MATLVKNNTDGEATLPTLYANVLLGPGASAIIADTAPNIVAALGAGAANFVLSSVPDGQPGAIPPASLLAYEQAPQLVDTTHTVSTKLVLTPAQSGLTIVANGAAKVGMQLPPAAGNIGVKYRMYAKNANGIGVYPGNTTDIIQVGIVGPTTANTGHADTVVAGSSMTVESDGAQWNANVGGTWTAT